MTGTDLTKLINHRVNPTAKLEAIEDAFFDAALKCVVEFEKSGSQSSLRTGGLAARVSLLAMRDNIRYYPSSKKV